MRTLLRTARSLFKAPQTLIEVRIRREAILANYRTFLYAYGLPVAPVLKSNAYGHGLREIASILAPERPPFVVVDSYWEARLLRSQGIKTPILVIGYTAASAAAGNRLRDVSFTLGGLEALRELAAKKARVRVHVKIDTGMHRQGLLPSEAEEAIGILSQSALRLEGICSHFADADNRADSSFTRAQIAVWNAQAARWRAAFPALRFAHVAATAGSGYLGEIDANLFRLGSGLYGFPRHASHTFPLSHALSLWSILTGTKEIAPCESIGYGRAYIASRPMRIATVPLGYFEGIDRRLSNRGCMLVGESACPIVGRVSMNMTTIDVSDVPEARLGTPVAALSDRADDPNSIDRAAALCGTTPLELLVHLPAHLRRVVH